MKCKVTGKSYKTMRTFDAKVKICLDESAEHDIGNYQIIKKHVTLYIRNMDLDYEYIIGSMLLYQLPFYDEGDQMEWSDCKSRCMIDLVEVKKRLCDYDSEERDEDTAYFSHHILDEFYIRPQYRGRGYAYSALAEGLKQAGCQDSFIYLYPCRMHVKEDGRFNKFETKEKAPTLNKAQLRKFYKNMSPCVTSHTCKSYNTKGRHKGKDTNETYLAVRMWDYTRAKQSKLGVI